MTDLIQGMGLLLVVGALARAVRDIRDLQVRLTRMEVERERAHAGQGAELGE